MSSGAALAIVDEPGRGRVFERTIMPGIADAGDGGRVCVDALARWLQDVAYLDLVDAGLEADGAWIMRRGRLVVESFPRFGDEVELRTFCSGIGRFSAERRTSMRGSSARVETVAIWVWLDAETLRPRRFGSEFAELYGESAGGRDAGVRLGHPDPPTDAVSTSWRFRASDIDVAGHVNNASYLAPLEEELSGGEPQRIELEIEYREPAHAGEVAILSAGSRRWIVGREGAVHASMAIG